MKTYFKMEIKKALFSWKTIISAMIIFAALLSPYLKEMYYQDPSLDGVDTYIRLLHFSYVGFIGPVIAGVIYSTSIISDVRSGLITKLLAVIDAKTYFIVKSAVNALTAFIVFALSHGILILYLIISYGVDNAAVNDISGGSGFSGIYYFSKILYIAFILLVTSFSSSAFSFFMMGAATAVGKKGIAYIFPAFYVILTGIFFEIYSLNVVVDFNLTKLFNLVINFAGNGINVLIYDLILVLLGVVLLFRFGYKRFLTVY